MRLVLRFIVSSSILFVIIISLSVWAARQASPEWILVAWADHGEHQGLVRLSLENGVQAYYRPTTIYNPEFVPSPDGMWLVYDRSLWGNSDIYRIRIHDGLTQNLTQSSANETLSDWSPDGRWLLFWSQDEDGIQLKRLEWASGRIVSMGGFVNDVVTNDTVNHWSPDGSAVYFVTTHSRGVNLHVIDKDGRERVYEMGNTDQVDVQAWSPDGNWLIFNSPTENYARDLFRIRIADGMVEQLSDVEAEADFLTWSPDGEWLYFTTSIANQSSDLYRMRPDGGQQQFLTNFVRVRDAYLWSPNGDWLYFVSRSGGGQEAVFRMRPDGGQVERVVAGVWAVRDLFWSQDFKWLYVVVPHRTGREMDVYRVRTDGSDYQLVVRDLRSLPVFSPDGEWLVFSTQRRLNEELFRIRPDGTERQQLTFSAGRNVDMTFQAWLHVPEVKWRPLVLGILGFGSIGFGVAFRMFDKWLDGATI